MASSLYFLSYIFFSSCYLQDVACKEITKQFHVDENKEVNTQDIIETRVLCFCCNDKTTTDILIRTTSFWSLVLYKFLIIIATWVICTKPIGVLNGIFCKLFMKILSGNLINLIALYPWSLQKWYFYWCRLSS